jgi:hypothetical protein
MNGRSKCEEYAYAAEKRRRCRQIPASNGWAMEKHGRQKSLAVSLGTCGCLTQVPLHALKGH